MPELPEVETTLRGIQPHIEGKRITDIVIRNASLRWPIPKTLKQQLVNQPLTGLARRGKYLLLAAPTGTAILHLGMSGSLRITDKKTPAEKHDHVDIVFDKKTILRFRDPRRFGCLLWTTAPVTEHKLIKIMGPEPFDEIFTGDYLHKRSRQRKVNVKSFIMDAKTVTGVGNIYASEALFAAGIRPSKQAGRIAKKHYALLATAIQKVLIAAIAQGGTSLKDFTREDGQPGYFKQSLNVYGREGKPCPSCQQPIKQKTIAQRATYYCSQCQT